MYLIQLDENNIVIASHGDLTVPLLMRLSSNYIVAPGPTAVGRVFDPNTRMFELPARRRWVTKLAFWNRMTQAERITIDLASERPEQLEGELAADYETRRATAAALRDMRTQMDAASYMDLTRADTRGGVQALEAMGLLGAGRALEILDGAVLNHEYFPDA